VNLKTVRKRCSEIHQRLRANNMENRLWRRRRPSRHTAAQRSSPIGKDEGFKLETLQAAMGKLQHCSTAGEATRRVQSGAILKNSRNLTILDKIGETNDIYERYVFNSRDQKESESIDAYLGELRTLAQSCNFCTCREHDIFNTRSDCSWPTWWRHA